MASEILLEQEIGAPAPRPALAAVPPIGRDDAVVADPELEAYLSAPPTEAELRAIRGGFVRRSLRPFALASGAVLLGGLVLALLFGDESSAPAAGGEPSPDMDSSIARELRPEERPDLRLDPRLGTPLDDSGSAPDGSTQPILGRIRGPVLSPPAAPADRPEPTPTRNPGVTPKSTRTGEAMAGSGTPLVPAGELDDREGAPAPSQSAMAEDEAVSQDQDFRPPDLVAPARIDDSDL